ncbi:sulfatase family protein [Arenibacter palladensis]|uniref:sulfatase family protein n=1 Tax=Arenibacter palladensis TaxID=237373 RepID=UPI0026E45B1D|nr:sulfatase [Arenibacter palladensis]MDO6604539.1 sulfatase [Arenibacter palladensis]
MKTLKVLSTILLIFYLGSSHAQIVVEKRPNIVWIMLEDWGLDLGCYGTKGIETPVTDQLASEGIRYTNAFCTSPVCSTSRSAMITGFHQNYIGAEQHRTEKAEKQDLPYGIEPMPLLLKKAGYFTALMLYNKTDANFNADLGFMGEDWKEREKGQPFFAQITLGGTHRAWNRDPKNPINPNDIELPPYYVDTPFARRDWANGLEQMQICDREIGDILKRLDKEGLTENTLVFLIGDNGRCHIRGKQFLYDPGLQVPLIIRWPGKVAPNQVNEDMVQTIDITATILDVAGAKPKHPLQGKNLFEEASKNREFIFAARDRMGGTHDAMRTIRSKKYKLIHNLMPERAWLQYSGYKEDMYPMLAEMNVLYMEGKLNEDQAKFFAPNKPEFELYDIEKDPFELNNLASDLHYGDIKDRLLTELYNWRKSIKDKGVSQDFREGGLSSKYPTRTLEEWKERYETWKPWVFREPKSKEKHPFVKKDY